MAIYALCYLRRQHAHIQSLPPREVDPKKSYMFWHVLPPMGSITMYRLVNIQESVENHHFQWENSLVLWPFSIATLNYLRVLTFAFGAFQKLGFSDFFRKQIHQQIA